jgi:glycosyltransferase involved in cell wall biosynthesis
VTFAPAVAALSYLRKARGHWSCFAWFCAIGVLRGQKVSCVNSRVLFEAFNLPPRGGTGIATYIRNLIEASRANGYSVDALFHSNAKLASRDPLLGEVGFYDARNFSPSKFTLNIESNWRRGIGVPTGIAARRLHPSGMIVDSGASGLGAVSMVDRAYVARMFMDFSRFHFLRYGTAARLRLPEQPDLFHATQMVPIKVPKIPNIYTIHDLVPILLPYTTHDDKRFFLSAVRYLCKSADHIVTVSEKSRADIIALTGIAEDRITNTYQAITVPDATISQTEDRVANSLENLFDLRYREYFLFCGALEPKKNVSRLLSAYAASGSKYPLVIAGPLGWQYEEDLARIESDQFVSWKISGETLRQQRKVKRLSYLPHSHLMLLMRGARALLFPSIYEGFGLPVLEAMTLGTPVMTSNVASLPEIAGEAAILVDPLDTDAITQAIKSLDSDADLRSYLQSRGPAQARKFSQENYQKRIGTLYRSVLGSSTTTLPAYKQAGAQVSKG